MGDRVQVFAGANPSPEDHTALLQLLARLSRAVDRFDRDLIVACYTPDGFDDHGGFKGSPEGFADYICGGRSDQTEAAQQRNSARGIHHMLGQSIFEVHGDEAVGETYGMLSMFCADSSMVQGFYRYEDRFRKIDGHWLIHNRTVVAEWVGEVASIESMEATRMAFRAPSRNGNDPSYELANSSLQPR